MSKLWDTKLLQIAESTLEMQKISVTESLSVHLTNKITLFCPNDIRNRSGDQHKNKESQSD